MILAVRIYNVQAAFVVSSRVLVYKQMVRHAQLTVTVYQEYAMLKVCANQFLTKDIVLRQINVLMAQFVNKMSAFTTMVNYAKATIHVLVAFVPPQYCPLHAYL